ncbi:MAG: fibrobacter succinogenes major paralogous domain-containing protein, partial [Fibromonadales bacterium]|nr:fibrobacter succinogenes major paralogous domain-containing protein [Fibromonadales bacterium]
CGGVDYNPVTQYCDGSDNMVKNMSTCGSHDPTTHFCDARGGKLYKYIVIGTQTWMAENLNFNAIGSKCYNNLESNCDIYGRLYNWATAMDIAASYDSSSYTASAKHRGICPAGWHIPSDAEWTALTDFVGGESTAGTKLKAASGWNYHATYGNGTDDYGFSALPGGNGNSGGIFSNVGSVGYWWSASEDSAANAYLRDIYYNNEYAYWRYSSKTFLRSLRCSQD